MEEGGRDEESDGFAVEGLMLSAAVVEEVEEELLHARVKPVIVEHGLSAPSSPLSHDVNFEGVTTTDITDHSVFGESPSRSIIKPTHEILLRSSQSAALTDSSLPEFIDPPSSTLIISDDTRHHSSGSADSEVEVGVGFEDSTMSTRIGLLEDDEEFVVSREAFRSREKNRVDVLTNGAEVGRPRFTPVVIDNLDDASKGLESKTHQQSINSKVHISFFTASVPQTAWSSTQALSQFLLVRGRKDLVKEADRSTIGADIDRSKVIDQVVQVEPASTLTFPPPAPIVLPFCPPAFMSTALDTPQPFTFRIIASPALLQMRDHYEAFPSFDIQILDRSFRYAPIPHVVQEPHLILSGTTCVIFHRLIKIVGSSVRREELPEAGRQPEQQKIDEAIFTSLSRLAGVYDRVVCILEEFPKGEGRSSSKRRDFAYTPPVLKALNTLSDAIKERKKSGLDGLLEVVITRDPVESIGVVRKLLINLSEGARERSRAGSLFEDCLGDRLWVTDDPSEVSLCSILFPSS